jgi:hypothetical protein
MSAAPLRLGCIVLRVLGFFWFILHPSAFILVFSGGNRGSFADPGALAFPFAP